ncbi:GAF domain-containing protein [Leptolyngbya sp. AN02str]|uniref:GAF domain-containing protein n=1 Tax=Leptolyngbya sp. AN02str TaxID=3423363 RepID=UPI003D31D510
MMTDEKSLSLLCQSSVAQFQLGQSTIVQQLEQDLTSILLHSNTPSAAIAELLSTAGQILLANQCAVAVLNSENEIQQIIHWAAPAGVTTTKPGTPHALKQLLELDTVQQQVRERSLVDIADLSTLAIAAPKSLHSSHTAAAASPQADALTGAALLCKTQCQGRHNGLLLVTKPQPYAWTELELQLFQTLANQTAIAIAQFHLSYQVQQQAQYQALLNQVTAAIRSHHDLESIYTLVLEGLVHTLQVSRGMVLSLKYGDPRLKGQPSIKLPKARVVVESLYPSPSAESLDGVSLSDEAAKPTLGLKLSIQVADCAMCRQLLTLEHDPLVLPAPANADWVATLHDEPVAPIFDLSTMPTMLAMPLENQGVNLGCLVVQHRRDRQWQPEEIAFVQLMAAQISTAIIQTRTLRQVQSLVDERTSQLRHSLDVQAKLYERTRQQVEQLRRMNRLQEELLSTVSHELLTPLTSMKLAIRMLREESLSPEQRDRYLSILDQQCNHETQLINNLLAIQKLEADDAPLDVQQLDLRYVLRDFQQSWVETLEQKQLSLDYDMSSRPLLIRTDSDSLHRILTELLENATKYSDPGSCIILDAQLSAHQPTPHIEISFSNTGVGILPEEQSEIFEKFRRGSEAIRKAIPGIGLGLALVKGLTAHLSGAIAAASQPIEGSQSWETRFTLSLPQSPELLH